MAKEEEEEEATEAPAPAEDANRSNTLVFLALDAEKALLYVSEQSNHRVRCIHLDGAPAMTCSVPAPTTA